MNSAYECELCGDRLTSYRAMMECEQRCYAEMVAARKQHVPPKVMRPISRWEDDRH